MKDRKRVFYVAYTWQKHPHDGQRIASSRVELVNCEKLTNDEVTSMREKIAELIGAPIGSIVITFFAELEG